jgi:hypothetical protein
MYLHVLRTRMQDEFEKLENDRLGCIPIIFWTEETPQDKRPTNRDANSKPSEYEAGALIIRAQLFSEFSPHTIWTTDLTSANWKCEHCGL